MNLTLANYTNEKICCGIKFFAFWLFSNFLMQIFALPQRKSVNFQFSNFEFSFEILWIFSQYLFDL